MTSTDAATRATARPWHLDATAIRRARLLSGSVLYTYVTLHLTNHALALVSLDVAERVLLVLRLVWRSPPGTIALYGALLVHAVLALWAIYLRRRLRMNAGEWARLVLGLAIVPLMAAHVVANRVAPAAFGIDTDYVFVLLGTWVQGPVASLRQAIGLLAAWVHGCIGLHLVLRLKPWYPRWVALLYAAAVLLPALALLGFVSAGREVELLAADPHWIRQYAASRRQPTREEVDWIYAVADGISWGFAALLATTLMARTVRSYARRRSVVRVTYPDKRVVEIQPGVSILDASRQAGIPHAEVCGGRGRCSTCRVRVGMGLESLPAASDAERKVLERIAAAPNVRLACQTRPVADIAVMPLLPPTASARDGFARARHLQGQEREIAILFADLRAFTGMAERKLPYDVVFLLNRYFASMGSAIEQSGGRVDKFIGDGVMALFGIERGPAEGCRQALAAARAMAHQLDGLNATLAHDLDQPLRIGIGIHVGPAIVGEMGYGSATTITAIGDAVNTASRLETLTKDYDCQLVLSEAVAQRAGVALSGFARHEIMVRGREGKMAIRVVPSAQDLPAGGAAAS
ncbi:MAG: adenylate/guanylate cyclase domain-containing protein [Alphaproteobacteria bacterium]|nr:adenylate/guanylate cyclase domain-containing protein [Alphaproteobacteria bacterium]